MRNLNLANIEADGLFCVQQFKVDSLKIYAYFSRPKNGQIRFTSNCYNLNGAILLLYSL